jgi:uncharacterized protein (DUF2236 family)
MDRSQPPISEQPVSRPVVRAEMEELWRWVEASRPAANTVPCAGLFGPETITWQVNRESAIFLAAGRAALLQLAHPWVAAALDRHSNLHSDPLARFHNTFRVVFTIVFGSHAQAFAASRHLYQLHTRIQGRLPATVGAYAEGSRYLANEVHALVWVFATLVESGLLAYDSVLPPLTAEQREAYYAESKVTAALFGIPPSALPASWAGFEDYMDGMLASQQLGVDTMARAMAHRILHGRGSWAPIPGWYRALTAAWLPERFRDEFELPFGPREQRQAARAQTWLPRVYRRLPTALRFVGPYREAQTRLRGQPPGLVTRASNRFWMGQPRMMFAETGRK